MSSFRQRRDETARRAAERRKREDSAPRLQERVPELKTLILEIHELRGTVAIDESKHVRHIVVPHAPALFDLPCLDPSCVDGGHDVTNQILRSLTAGETRFEGEHACHGRTGSADCQRALRYVAVATYKA
jgi:hypothetical protein